MVLGILGLSGAWQRLGHLDVGGAADVSAVLLIVGVVLLVVLLVLVRDGEVLGEGWNAPIGRCDPTAHAEIVALRSAANALCNYRLSGSTLYVSIEPCAMCAGALVHARVARVVFAAREPRAGAVASNLALLDAAFLNHRVAWSEGVCADDAARMMRDFFRRRRP